MYKYKTSFQNEIVASAESEISKNSIQASLDSLKSLAPEIDLEENIDLIGVAFNAAVVNTFNKNHDGISTDIAKAVYKNFVHKPTNIEHKKEKVVGHIISSGFSEFNTNKILSESEIQDEDLTPFNIALSSVIYKVVNKDFANLIEKSLDEEDALFNAISASWEIGFNDFAIALGSKNLKDAEIVTEPKHVDELQKYLKAFDGEGITDKGEEVYRLVIGDVYPLGIGFTTNPAANVKGLIGFDSKKKEQEEVYQERPAAEEKIEIDSESFLKKIIKNKNKFSHMEKEDVILDKANLNSDIKTMEMKELINELKETIEASASDKFSDEAVANIVKVVTESIKERSDQYVQERAEAEKQQQELAEAKEEATKKVSELEKKLEETLEKLSSVEAEQKAAADLQLFNDRMSSLDSEYELSEADRKIIAEDLKSVDANEEAFAAYQERMSVIYSHKSKKFLEDQEKSFQEKLEKEIEARTKQQTEKVVEASETESSESTEDVEEVLESVEASEEISSNNGETVEQELSLQEKFKNAFSKESITIKY